MGVPSYILVAECSVSGDRGALANKRRATSVTHKKRLTIEGESQQWDVLDSKEYHALCSLYMQNGRFLNGSEGEEKPSEDS